MSNPRLRQVVQILAFFGVLFFGVFFLFHITDRFWSDSEIWGLRQGQYCAHSWRSFACSWKPIFYFIVGKFTNPDLTQLMSFARGLSGFWWLVSAAILFWNRIPMTLLVCYFGSSLFLLDSNVARSDFWALPAVLFVCAFLNKDRLGVKPYVSILIILSGSLLAILISPKSMVILLCLSPIILQRLSQRISKKKKIVVLTTFLALGVAAVFVSRLFIQWNDVAVFFVRQLDASEYGVSYWDLQRFYYIGRAWLENPQLPILFVGWLGMILISSLEHSRPLTARHFAAMLLFASMFLYPDKLPFWLSCQTLAAVVLIAPDFVSDKVLKAFVIAPTILSLFVGICWSRVLPSLNNERQKLLVSYLDANDEFRIYDGLGLVSGNASVPFFLGPDQKDANDRALQSIRAANFEVIALTHRTKIFAHLLGDYLEKNYIESSPDLLIKVFNIEVSEGTRAEEIKQQFADLYGLIGSTNPLVSVLQFNEDTKKWRLQKDRAEPWSEIQKALPLGKASHLRLTPLTKLLLHPPPYSYDSEFRFEPEGRNQWHWPSQLFLGTH